jgi:hypothetical protein
MKLTEKQVELFAQFIEDYNGGDVQFIEDYNGGDVQDYIDWDLEDELELTSDGLEQFDGRHWNEWSGRTYETVGDYPAVHYDKVRAQKGQTRVALWVMDFGDFRAVYQI